MKIKDILLEYNSKLDSLDLELIIAHILNKPREFVLAHPEFQLTMTQEKRCEQLVKRRINHEPLAYILGHKEFYGLDFKVNKNVLIPRPETELLVEEVLKSLKTNSCKLQTVVDIGTGSGNIIISIAKLLWTSDVQIQKGHRMSLFGLDISSKALAVAKQNAKKNKVGIPPAGRIEFIKSNLLDYFFKNEKNLLKIVNCKLIIICNLPYLSKKIYSSAMPDVKNYEPKIALYAKNDGLYYYEKLFQQIKKMPNTKYQTLNTILEISPEQKNKMQKLILKYFPRVKIIFKKDLAGKWRMASFKI